MSISKAQIYHASQLDDSHMNLFFLIRLAQLLSSRFFNIGSLFHPFNIYICVSPAKDPGSVSSAPACPEPGPPYSARQGKSS